MTLPTNKLLQAASKANQEQALIKADEITTEVKEETKDIPVVAKTETEVTQDTSKTIIPQIGPTYRLMSAPASLRFQGHTHVYLDGIVRPLSQPFAEFMKELAKSGGATVVKED